jgi:hypothetical protein
VAIARRENLPEIAITCGNLAEMVIAFGDLNRGFAVQDEARRAVERLGSVVDRRWLRGARAVQDYLQGRWEVALQGVQELLAQVDAGSPHFIEGPAGSSGG